MPVRVPRCGERHAAGMRLWHDQPPPPSRRLATAARWPLGVLKTGWDYLWRTTPMHRSETAGSMPADRPPALPSDCDRTDLQGVDDGHGPLMHRSYVARVREAELSARELIRRFGD